MNDETREAIGTVWHTTEKGRDIVSMHDAQYRAHIARIAALEEAVRVLAEAVVQWDSRQEENYYTDALRKTRKALENPIARAAVEKARNP